jgi:hypothetical protein
MTRSCSGLVGLSGTLGLQAMISFLRPDPHALEARETIERKNALFCPG